MPKGLTRRVDDLGRIVVPVEVRRSLNWEPGDEIQISWSGTTVSLRKPTDQCLICSKSEGLHKVNGENICLSCRIIAARTLK
jgi:AbrB family transcriptional regulator, transcriptional pleiotropic regulator of transition state genes